jgi:photosynthetic reaction center cytochrome c subunit
MKRVQLVLFAIALFLLLNIPVQAGKSQSGIHAGTDVSGKKAEEQYKNIQVLKGVPADQIIPGMQFIAASLGVECQFCHVQDAFDKDDKKPKQIARKMMTMMFAINKDNFDDHRQVTCYSCHRGDPLPVSTPPVLAEGANPVLPAVSAETDKHESEAAPSADQLFDKYVQALGGSAAIERISSRIMKGTITFGDRNIPIDIYAKDPEKRISFTHTPDGDNVTAFNGYEGWLGSPGRPPRNMHGQELDAAAMDADLHFALHLKQMFSEAKVQGTEKIGDADTYAVVGTREDKSPVQLYFDKNSGLLVRLVRYSESPLGRLPTQIDYADYRETGRVKIPFRWTLARTNGRFTIQLSEVKSNVAVDDARFDKPAGTPEQPSTK